MKRKCSASSIGALTLAVATAISPRAEAQTAANADAVYKGYLDAYLVQSSASAYVTTSTTNRSVDYMWNQAEDITGVEDHWYRTHSAATATLVSDLLNGFEAHNKGTDWSWDKYDDDLGWATIAFVRGYEITGDAGFLSAAENNFNTVWSRGWDAAGGGGIWEQVAPGPENQRSVLATGPFIITGAALYTATGNSTYLSEAETAYAWERANVFNATSSTNSRGAPGHVNEGLTETGALQNTSNLYNEGLMLESAAALYILTNNQEYLDDAKLVIQFTESKWPLVNHQSDMFFRGLGNFAWQNNLWSTYLPYLQANAAASWNERRTDHNITNDDFTKATSSTAELNAMQAMSSLTIQEVTANGFMPPRTVDLSGTHEIQNVASGLALSVSGDSTAAGAAIVQLPSASGAASWRFIAASTPGYYRIQSVQSGLSMSVSNASRVIGAPIVQSPAVQTAPFNDQWLPVLNSDGTFSFYNLATTLALDEARASTTANQLDQWYPNGSDAQGFRLVPSQPVAPEGADAGVGGAANSAGGVGDGAGSGPDGVSSGGTGVTNGGAGTSGTSQGGNANTLDGGVGAASTESQPGATDGCGCRTAHSPSSSSAPTALGLLALASLLARRRRASIVSLV